jgi:hypothetical protein
MGRRMFPRLVLFVVLGAPFAQSSPQWQNPGFEATAQQAGQVPGWQISSDAGANGALVKVDEAQGKEGRRALLIESKDKEPASVSVSQELFLPVGTTWKVSVWIKRRSLGGATPAL